MLLASIQGSREAMEIIYLGKGELRPSGDRALLIECRSAIGGDEFTQHASGAATIRIRPEGLSALIADLEHQGATKVYVRRLDIA
jgi:hypothetical protein